MLNTGYIKCLIVDDEPMARDVIRRYIEKVPTLQIAGEHGNAIDAMLFLQQTPVDLLFLDIQMPHLNGTDFVKSLRNPPKIIFTTAYKEYALEGYELDAVDYLLKPIRFDRFLRSINKAFPQERDPSFVEKVAPEKTKTSGFIYLKSERKMIKVFLHDINYIESARDYIKVYTENGTIITRQTISSIEAMLSDTEFVRVHRSFVVSVDKIKTFTHETIQVGKSEIPIGKFYLNSFLKLQGHLSK